MPYGPRITPDRTISSDRRAARVALRSERRNSPPDVGGPHRFIQATSAQRAHGRQRRWNYRAP